MMLRAHVFALVGIMLAATPAARRFEAEASGSCANTQTSGAIATQFSTCVTDTGNVRKFVTVAPLDNFATANSGDSYTIATTRRAGRTSHVRGAAGGSKRPTSRTRRPIRLTPATLRGQAARHKESNQGQGF